MPRKKTTARAGSAFRQVQQQARALLIDLRKQIRAKEIEIERLRSEESSLGNLTGRAGVVAAGAGRRAVGGGRIDWSVILEQLPKQFKAADVRSVRGVRNKRSSEIFAAITRWIDAGLAKRKNRGLYERT